MSADETRSTTHTSSWASASAWHSKRGYRVTPERMCGRQPFLKPVDMQDAACDVHLGEGQAAGFQYPQAMPEYPQEKARVAGFVPCAFDGSYELFDFGRNRVLTVAHHCVQQPPPYPSGGRGYAKGSAYQEPQADG